ncbi:MAG: hypothetical protein KatS3mg059_0630 [Thermomicrobiales bacterium]|nr:MAG: hypothetical protein KatS3mg059_0630 [Thermomicrobiales bacterium]
MQAPAQSLRKMTRRRLVGAALGVPIVALAGCGTTRTPSTDDLLLAWPAKDRWPAVLNQAPAEVQEAYRFAVAHPDVLRSMPCFCGCGAQGHTSNYDCYVREVRADGSVLLDPMSFG